MSENPSKNPLAQMGSSGLLGTILFCLFVFCFLCLLGGAKVAIGSLVFSSFALAVVGTVALFLSRL